MLEELKALQQSIETEFNNLSNHQWLADKLKALKVQYDTIENIIKKEEDSTNATTPGRQRRNKSSTDSNS